MDLYSGLFESMLDCCCRSWLRRGPVYTVSMVALALAASLNLLSIIDLLWIFGVLNNPYHIGHSVHPPRYLWSLLCVVFLASSMLARRRFNGGARSRQTRVSAVAAPIYLVGSVVLFVITLIINIRFDI